MPSLQELLHDVRCDSGVTLSAYALFKGLVDVVKPEIDVAAEGALAEAKAEIERLSRELDILLNTADHLSKRYKKALHDRDQAEAELATKNADADLGRMVRRMPANTGLKHYSNGTWYAMRYCRDVGWCTIRVDLGTHDPAEALRSIQEMCDDEG